MRYPGSEAEGLNTVYLAESVRLFTGWQGLSPGFDPVATERAGTWLVNTAFSMFMPQLQFSDGVGYSWIDGCASFDMRSSPLLTPR